MTPHSAPTGRFAALASGKGGVGKTFLAIGLAQALAASGRRVLLFDGDLGLANIDIQLGLLPRCDLAPLLEPGRDPLEAIQPCPGCGFDLLAGHSGSGLLGALDPPRLGQLLAALHRATRRYDLVLADLAAGIDHPVRRLAAAADALLLVITDDPTSLTDAYAVLKLHAVDGGTHRRSVIVNQAASHAEGRRSHARLARATENFLGFAPDLVGIVRRDPKVREAIRRQTPLLSQCRTAPASLDLTALAADPALADALGLAAPAPA